MVGLEHTTDKRIHEGAKLVQWRVNNTDSRTRFPFFFPFLFITLILPIQTPQEMEIWSKTRNDP